MEKISFVRCLDLEIWPQYWQNLNIQKETTPENIKVTPEPEFLKVFK
jgi:hypothetical protein